MRYLKEFSKIQDYNKVANVLKDVSDILNEMEANKTTAYMDVYVLAISDCANTVINDSYIIEELINDIFGIINKKNGKDNKINII